MKRIRLPSENNRHIKEYLDAYLLMPRTDFAVLLKGPWGCGKTHFITSYLHEKQSFFTHECPFVYLSLNGVATSSDFETRILSAASQPLNSGLAGSLFRIWQRNCPPFSVDSFSIRVPAATLNLSKTVSKRRTQDNRRLLEKLHILGNGLLVLDDFERCTIPISQRAGMVAELLNDHLKVVMVCADNELDPTWQRYKEKIIGKTFSIEENIDRLFGTLVDGSKFQLSRPSLMRNKDRIIACFQEVEGAYNYRALLNAIRDLEFWFSKLPKSIRHKDSFTDDFVVTFIAFAYEIQLGRLPESEFGCRCYTKNNSTHFQELLRRHHLTFDEPFSDRICLSLAAWRRILYSLPFDNNVFLSDVKQHPALRSANAPEWQTLWHWYMLSDEEANLVLKRTLDKVKCRRYTNPEVILHVFAILFGLAKIKAISQEPETVKEEFHLYISDVVASKRLEDSPNAQTEFRLTAFPLSVWNDGKEPEIQRFKKQLADAVLAVRSEQMAQRVLSQSFDSFDPTFFNQIAPGGEFYSAPIFRMVDPRRFWDGFCRMKNDDKGRVHAALDARFISNSNQKLVEELPFFEQVKQLAKADLDKKRLLHPKTPSFIRKQNLLKLLSEICDYLQQANKTSSEQSKSKPL